MLGLGGVDSSQDKHYVHSCNDSTQEMHPTESPLLLRALIHIHIHRYLTGLDRGVIQRCFRLASPPLGQPCLNFSLQGFV